MSSEQYRRTLKNAKKKKAENKRPLKVCEVSEVMNINRRRILQGMTIGAGATAMSAGRISLASTESHGFTHGIASGDPLSDRVILWTRYLPQERS